MERTFLLGTILDSPGQKHKETHIDMHVGSFDYIWHTVYLPLHVLHAFCEYPLSVYYDTLEFLILGSSSESWLGHIQCESYKGMTSRTFIPIHAITYLNYLSKSVTVEL